MTFAVNKTRVSLPSLTFVVLLCTSTLAGCKFLAKEPDDPFADDPDKIWLGGCGREAIVDDGEDDDHRILQHADRGGYMYTFVDSAGSTVTPPPGSQAGAFYDISGANGSLYGGRFFGDLGTASVVYAGYGMNLREPRMPYDASKYEGIAFFGRRAPDSSSKVRIKLLDIQTDPAGGLCSECFNAFGANIELTDKWEQYVVRFEEMQQEEGWGAPRPSTIDTSALYAVQFQVSSPGAHYDMWIDDIAFFGCRNDE